MLTKQDEEINSWPPPWVARPKSAGKRSIGNQTKEAREVASVNAEVINKKKLRDRGEVG